MDQRFLDRNKLQNCPLFVKKYFEEIPQEMDRDRLSLTWSSPPTRRDFRVMSMWLHCGLWLHCGSPLPPSPSLPTGRKWGIQPTCP